MSEEAEEKTEQPSDKRLREAREQGRFAHSRELGGAAVFAAGAIALIATGGGSMQAARAWMRGALQFQPTGPSQERLLSHIGSLAAGAFDTALPIMIACLLAALVAPLFMGGLHFSAKALAPDWSRINPMAGFKRLYGREALVELLRALSKVVLIGGVMYVLLKGAVPAFLGLPQQALPAAAATAFQPVRGVLVAFVFIVLLIAAIDVPYQLWNYRKSLKMTRQEVKQEMKESEGSPEVKGRIRRLQHQLAQRRMLEDIPAADVVLVNPTHYAVALKYEAGTTRAPKVVAKGLDEIALTIRKLADAHAVPIVESPPLARALYRQAQVGQEIPVALYAAVASILGYVYQLRTWRRDGGRAPVQPSVEVPSSLSDPEPTP